MRDTIVITLILLYNIKWTTLLHNQFLIEHLLVSMYHTNFDVPAKNLFHFVDLD